MIIKFCRRSFSGFTIIRSKKVKVVINLIDYSLTKQLFAKISFELFQSTLELLLSIFYFWSFHTITCFSAFLDDGCESDCVSDWLKLIKPLALLLATLNWFITELNIIMIWPSQYLINNVLGRTDMDGFASCPSPRSHNYWSTK